MSATNSIDDDLRVFRKDEVAQRLAFSVDTVDRLLAAGELATLRPRRKGVVVQIRARWLRRYIYGVRCDRSTSRTAAPLATGGGRLRGCVVSTACGWSCRQCRRRAGSCGSKWRWQALFRRGAG